MSGVHAQPVLAAEGRRFIVFNGGSMRLALVAWVDAIAAPPTDGLTA